MGAANALNGAAKYLSLMPSLTLWIAKQGDRLTERLDQIFNECKSCDRYLKPKNSDKQSTENHIMAILASMYALEEAGFKENAKQGDKSPRWSQASFIKTEKGWKAMQQ